MAGILCGDIFLVGLAKKVSVSCPSRQLARSGVVVFVYPVPEMVMCVYQYTFCLIQSIPYAGPNARVDKI